MFLLLKRKHWQQERDLENCQEEAARRAQEVWASMLLTNGQRFTEHVAPCTGGLQSQIRGIMCSGAGCNKYKDYFYIQRGR